MAANKKILNADQKRKILLILRFLLLTAAVLYLLFLLYNNYFVEDKYKIYFSTADAANLEIESRTINEENDLYYELFKELKAGPQNEDLRATIPEGSELLDYEIEDSKIILNFNFALKSNHWGGSAGEQMTVYSIVNTYTSLEQIESVEFELEGENIESLVGHLDLSQPLMYNQKLLGDS